MDLLQMVLQGTHSGKDSAAKSAVKRLEFHVNALRVVLQVRYRLESLATVIVGALIGAHTALNVSQHVAFQVLLLFENLVTSFECAGEPPNVALQVPVELAFADELLVGALGALELQLLAHERRLAIAHGTR